MGLFDKLKEILFDEETVEIPVITKEEPEKKKSVKSVQTETEEVIVHKIENLNDEEDLFDMPKLKEEAKEEVRTSTFTFPVFDDEDLDLKETSRTSKKKEEKKETKEEYKKNSSRSYDYLSSTDYRVKKESNDNRTTSRLNSVTSTADSKKPFTLSPIISPVYGILNENYKKEDIVTRNDSSSMRLSTEKVDLDSVRKKAYGTLEDEIEASLSRKMTEDVLEEVPTEEELTIDDLKDDGLMITDFLIEKEKQISENKIEEVFDIDEEITMSNEIEIDDENIDEDITEKKEKKGAIGEEDLFDLIDSLYAGKGEN